MAHVNRYKFTNAFQMTDRDPINWITSIDRGGWFKFGVFKNNRSLSSQLAGWHLGQFRYKGATTPKEFTN